MFKCKLVDQDSTRTTCTSPKTYTNLTAGSTYTFKVWAKDAAGNIDPTPATLSFTSSDSGGATDSGGDRDADGIPDTEDNCPDVYNRYQNDRDGDGVGNKCDDGSTPPTDTDNDGVIDVDDQCDTEPGPAPTGCPAEPGGDRDGDTIPDTEDNCPDVYNKGQRDDDGDGVGNKCEYGPTAPPPSSEWPTSDCEKGIRPGDDIDAIINNDASGTATTFCVYAGTYKVSTQATLKAGHKLMGQPGTTTTVGRATKPTPVVELIGSGSDNLLRADGSGISISWVDLSGANGTGNGTGAIAAGSAGSDFLVQFARIHNNASLGISNMKGTVLDSEFFSNSESSASLGFNASAVKGITEYEAARVYVHDEQGNGLWCDVGCSNDPARANGFWVYDSVVINSGRAGIRYENSPNQALFENNDIQGNGRTEWRGGIDIRDSQNAQVLNNTFGDNGNRIGVRATDSGRSDRVNLLNVIVRNNTMNNERIIGCDGRRVVCSNNSGLGTK